MSVTDLRPADEASVLPGTDLPPGGVPGYAGAENDYVHDVLPER